MRKFESKKMVRGQWFMASGDRVYTSRSASFSAGGSVGDVVISIRKYWDTQMGLWATSREGVEPIRLAAVRFVFSRDDMAVQLKAELLEFRDGFYA